ncbi:ornithine cyclodeaminase family protein [bacterium]|nr:ornithine cyclodeaminase family protein [bacterium]
MGAIVKKQGTLLLDQKTIRNILDLKASIQAVENAFRFMGKGKTQMPSKIYLQLDKFQGDFRAMPAFIEGLSGTTLKWVNVHPGNQRKGLPTVMAIIILSDPSTGYPLCIMDGTYVTAVRTAAAGGVAAKYLARKDAKQAAIIGTGVQAKYQLLALQEVLQLKQVSVFGINAQAGQAYVKMMKKISRLKILPAKTIRECVRNADVIVTTTPSKKPLIKQAWLKPGVHINAIGADAKGKQELEAKIVKQAKVVVDSWEQAAHSGEINVPLRQGILKRSDVFADIGQIVTKKKAGRTNTQEITLFDSTGLAIQDTALANLIYTKALTLKKKQYMQFISSPLQETPGLVRGDI